MHVEYSNYCVVYTKFNTFLSPLNYKLFWPVNFYHQFNFSTSFSIQQLPGKKPIDLTMFPHFMKQI